MSEATFAHKLVGQMNALWMPRALDLLNLRIYHYDRSVDPARPEYNQHGVIAFWHEYIVTVLPRWGRTPTTALCSQHRDGEWVNQTAASLGLHVVRGSSSRGGAKAIRKIRENCKFSSIAITPDGPRGPRRVMAAGPIYMASLLQIPLVMLGVGISNPIRLNTWDRFAIPRPSSRVRMVFGPKVHVPRKLDREGLEHYRLKAEQLLNDLTSEAENWAESNQKVSGAQPFYRVRRTNRLEFSEPVSPPQDRIAEAQLMRAA